MTARALILVAIFASTADAKPKIERMHRDAIPAGDGWWCYTAPSMGLSGCMRSEDKCERLVSSMGAVTQDLQQRGRGAGVDVPDLDASACKESHDVWVRTGMSGGEWRYQASPSKELCDNAPSWGMGMYEHESPCERWHEHDGPPDASIVPAGKGWWCTETSAGAICARAKDTCAIVAQVANAKACKQAKKAFVFTGGGRFHAFTTADACDSARDGEEDASQCAAP